MSEESMHVLGLTPQKQVAIKIVLSNFYKLALREWLEELQFNPSSDELREKQRRCIEMFDMYNEIAEVCVSKHSSSKGKSKLIMLAPISMKMLENALKTFNPSRNEITRTDADKVSRELDNLKKLVAESLKFQYSDTEIKRMGVS